MGDCDSWRRYGKDLKAIGRNISGGAPRSTRAKSTAVAARPTELQEAAEKLGANAVVGAAHAVYGSATTAA